jgi:hypothetical protein
VVVPGDPNVDPVAPVVPSPQFLSSLAFLLASACIFLFSTGSRFDFSSRSCFAIMAFHFLDAPVLAPVGPSATNRDLPL